MAPRRRPAAFKAVGAKAKSRSVMGGANPAPENGNRRASRRRNPGKEHSEELSWKPLVEFSVQMGQQLHLRGTYQGEPAERVGEVQEMTQHREGHWMKLQLTGSPTSRIREWRQSHTEGFYANHKVLARPIPAEAEGLFSVHDIRDLDPKSNLVNLQREGG